ncbi:DsrE family protein [Euzebya tangerina]|uniref:DsrE family protein n=1 Tax=Euzebya tangerina TaxID=591198 RepID=UPI000E315C21|nr:DsrE family protein [Euzebya tangerina]
MSKILVIKATHGLDDPERANLACNVAAVGVASGLDVHLFLAVDAVNLGLPEPPDLEVPHAPPIADLLEAVYGAGQVVVCTPCAARRGLEPEDFREGTVMGGSALFVELATSEDATALVY